MGRDLGGFTTVADRAKAKGEAALGAGVLFVAGAAAALRLGRYPILLAAAAIALVVYLVHRRVVLRRLKTGVVDVVDDAELGVVLVLRRDGPGVRVPLSKATLVGRGRVLATVGLVRLQIEAKWDEGSVVCNLAIPFRAGPDDVEGILPAQYDLDRTASRALDALSYEVKELAKPT